MSTNPPTVMSASGSRVATVAITRPTGPKVVCVLPQRVVRMTTAVCPAVAADAGLKPGDGTDAGAGSAKHWPHHCASALIAAPQDPHRFTPAVSAAQPRNCRLAVWWELEVGKVRVYPRRQLHARWQLESRGVEAGGHPAGEAGPRHPWHPTSRSGGTAGFALLALLAALLGGATHARHRAGHLLHHLAGFEEPVDEAVDLLHAHPGPPRDPQPARPVDDLRVLPLRRRHRPDDRGDPVQVPVVDLTDLVLDLAHPRQHAEQVADRAHPANHHHLLEEVLEGELAGPHHPLGHALGLVGLERLLGLLDQGEHVTHAEDSRRHPFGMEHVELVELLP